MVYTGTIVTEAEMQFAAGENVDATGDVEANHNILAAWAESYLSNLMEYNVVDNYGSLNEDIKRMLSEYAACLAAVYLIKYNMAGYTSTQEAEDMIDISLYRMNAIEDKLKKISITDYMKGA